jgi:hypothetical protein
MHEIFRPELFRFSYSLLQTTKSDKRHHTERSDILAPFNSSLCLSDKDAKNEYEEYCEVKKSHIYDKKRILFFGAKAIASDLRFERDNNVRLDQGVILEDSS